MLKAQQLKSSFEVRGSMIQWFTWNLHRWLTPWKACAMVSGNPVHHEVLRASGRNLVHLLTRDWYGLIPTSFMSCNSKLIWLTCENHMKTYLVVISSAMPHGSARISAAISPDRCSPPLAELRASVAAGHTTRSRYSSHLEAANWLIFYKFLPAKPSKTALELPGNLTKVSKITIFSGYINRKYL